MPIRFAEVIPGEIYRGGEPSVEDLKILKHIFGIKRILSLDTDIGFKIDPMCQELQINHVVFPLMEDLNQVYKLKNNIEKLCEVRPIYLHCKHGRDRTGFAVASLRIAEGMEPLTALKEAKKFNFPDGFTNDLKEFFTNILLNDSNKASDSDIVQDERDDHAPAPAEDTSHSYSPTIPMVDNDGIDNSLINDHKKLRKNILQDLNEAMAPTIGPENANPMNGVYGPIEPFGVYPFGYSMIY